MEFYHQLRDLLNPSPYNIAPYPSQEAGDAHNQSNIHGRDRDRLPQWTPDETREFLALRAQLDQSFIQTKRNKSLWRDISTQLKQKGFLRTPDQCKSKWKNLVARYKGSESMEGDANKQFPFYEEMRKMFSERMEKEKGAVQVQMIKYLEDQEDDINNEDLEDDQRKPVGSSSSKKKEKEKKKKARMISSSRSAIDDDQKDIVERALREFIRRQTEMETRWMEEADAREGERRAKEDEWRRWMEAVQTDRMEMERQWREREDGRLARAEARAERRHSLIMSLLDKLAKKGMQLS